MTDDDESYKTDGGHPSRGQPGTRVPVSTNPATPAGEREYVITDDELTNLVLLSAPFEALQIAERISDRVCSRSRSIAQPADALTPMLQDGEDPESVCKRKPICGFYPCGMEKHDAVCGMKLRLREVVQKEHDLAITTAAKAEMLDKAIKAIDDCWSNMKHGNSTHQHAIKRKLFLRFRKCIEVLRSTTTTPGTQDGERK